MANRGAKGTIATLVIAVLYLTSVDWQLPFPWDVVGYAIGRDFLNLWTMGLEAWGNKPGRFYDMSAYSAFISDLLGKDYPYQQWSYPPNSLLPGAPFGLLPYLSTYFIWMLADLGLFAYSVRSAGWTASPKFLLLLLASPAAIVCLIYGQNAFLTGATFLLIYRLWDTESILAGIVIGFLTLKPQHGCPLALCAHCLQALDCVCLGRDHHTCNRRHDRTALRATGLEPLLHRCSRRTGERRVGQSERYYPRLHANRIHEPEIGRRACGRQLI